MTSPETASNIGGNVSTTPLECKRLKNGTFMIFKPDGAHNSEQTDASISAPALSKPAFSTFAVNEGVGIFKYNDIHTAIFFMSKVIRHDHSNTNFRAILDWTVQQLNIFNIPRTTKTASPTRSVTGADPREELMEVLRSITDDEMVYLLNGLRLDPDTARGYSAMLSCLIISRFEHYNQQATEKCEDTSSKPAQPGNRVTRRNSMISNLRRSMAATKLSLIGSPEHGMGEEAAVMRENGLDQTAAHFHKFLYWQMIPYKSQANYSWDAVESMKTQLERLDAAARVERLNTNVVDVLHAVVAAEARKLMRKKSEMVSEDEEHEKHELDEIEQLQDLFVFLVMRYSDSARLLSRSGALPPLKAVNREQGKEGEECGVFEQVRFDLARHLNWEVVELVNPVWKCDLDTLDRVKEVIKLLQRRRGW